MCGIAAFFGKDGRDFEKTVFNYLLLSQDSRGRDNFGIAYTRVGLKEGETPRAIDIHRGWNGKYAGGKDTSTFGKIIEERGRVWIQKEFEWSYPIISIGHSRTASKGGTGIDNAHPFVCKGGDAENPRTLIGVHNGTIYNHEAVARSVGVNIGDTLNDSKAMLMCMAQSHDKTIETLSKYRGAAAFVWHIKEEPNRVYVWVGNDTNRAYFSQERDLHYINTIDGMYISSLKRPIENIMLCVPDWPDYTESPILVVEALDRKSVV